MSMQRKIIKWTAITLGSIAVLIVAATVALNLPPVQRYIKDSALQMLCREFNTTITLDEVDVSVINGHVGLYGLTINDLAGEKMLDVDTLYAGFDMWNLKTELDKLIAFSGGTGVGMSMAANKVPGIRAALCTTEFHASYARAHNNANIICLGERVTGPGIAADMVDIFLATQFEGGRHLRRISQFS